MTPNKSVTGLDSNILVLIIYLICLVLGFVAGPNYVIWLLPFVFYFIEKGNPFMQFYMLQGAVLFALNALITGILNGVKWGVDIMYFGLYPEYSFPYYGSFALAGAIITLNAICAILAVIGIIKAYKYEYFRIPLIYLISQKLNAAFSKIK